MLWQMLQPPKAASACTVQLSAHRSITVSPLPYIHAELFTSRAEPRA
jgi:hypothetical protein